MTTEQILITGISIVASYIGGAWCEGYMVKKHWKNRLELAEDITKRLDNEVKYWADRCKKLQQANGKTVHAETLGMLVVEPEDVSEDWKDVLQDIQRVQDMRGAHQPVEEQMGDNEWGNRGKYSAATGHHVDEAPDEKLPDSESLM